ncbi:hypothetical protein LUZ60_006155 [Juncus effusus]|nr:hypothetical protein LUZ60_006155 [Juncus effusus]
METSRGELEGSSSQAPQEFQLPLEDENQTQHFDEFKLNTSNSISPHGEMGINQTSQSNTIPMPPTTVPVLPWPPISAPIHQIGGEMIGPLFPSIHPQPALPTVSLTPPFFNEFYTTRASTGLQFGYDGLNCVGSSSSDPLGLAGLYMGGFASPSSPFFGKMSAQDIIDAKALAASKSHSEAERRRRERINGHLAKLRSMLPNTAKTDKASLLAEVIQHVKELKRQTSEIAEESPLPAESDELTVDALPSDDNDGHFMVRASLCCEDRSDLLPDLIRTLKSLRLRALKAEITTLAGRVKNVLVVTGNETDCDTNPCSDCSNNAVSSQSRQQQHSLVSVQEALRAVMERTAFADEGSGGSTKRQRTTTVVDHGSI